MYVIVKNRAINGLSVTWWDKYVIHSFAFL